MLSFCKIKEGCKVSCAKIYIFSWFIGKSVFIWNIIQLYSGEQLGGKGKRPLSFFENRKKVPRFWKKSLDCVHPWLKFPTWNAVLRASRRGNFKIFPYGDFILLVVDEIFIEEPLFLETSPSLKKSWLRAYTYC